MKINIIIYFLFYLNLFKFNMLYKFNYNINKFILLYNLINYLYILFVFNLLNYIWDLYTLKYEIFRINIRLDGGKF